jgi:RND family efflux transporter MFP subunit
MKIIRNILITLIALAALGAILYYMAGGFKEEIGPGKVEVKTRSAKGLPTSTVHAIVEMQTAEVVGTLKAQRRTDVSSKIMATIADVTVKAGDKVQKGQLVVRLDDRDMQARLEQARKTVEAAQANADQAAANLRRDQKLFEEKVIARQPFEEQQSRFKVAQAELERAKEAVREAQVALSYTQIESPSDGIVVDKHSDKGDTATPGKPLLTIYDPTVLRLETPVQETLAAKLHIGDRLRVRLDTLNLDVEGRVDEIVPQAEAASRSVLVKVAVPKEPKMVEGMYGRLMIPTGERKRFCVPASAVRRVGQLAFVDAVTTGGALERRPIKLGEHSEYGRIEAISGVEDGETVVVYGEMPPPMPVPTPANRPAQEPGRRDTLVPQPRPTAKPVTRPTGESGLPAGRERQP